MRIVGVLQIAICKNGMECSAGPIFASLPAMPPGRTRCRDGTLPSARPPSFSKCFQMAMYLFSHIVGGGAYKVYRD